MSDAKAIQQQLDKARRKVDVDHFDVPLRELLRMSEEGELQRAPAYQRKFRWDEAAESKLIESILLGLPVPSLYVATNSDGTWEVVDGLQRISSIIHFTANEAVTASSTKLLEEIGKKESLILEDLDILTTFNGLSIVDLPTPMRLNLLRRPLRLTALSDKSDFDVRFQTFERLNTGGVALTPQEVRACVYRGEFNAFLTELAEHADFKALVKLQKAKKDDGTREELVLKFFAYLYDRESFRGAVRHFLNNYMSRQLHVEFDYTEGRKLFSEVVKHIYSACDGPFLRTGTSVTPLNQLEAVLVGAAEALSHGNKLKKPKAGWQDDEELVSASTKGTNTPSALGRRIDRARAMFEQKTRSTAR